MPENYEVQLGDCMSSVAYEHGFFWQTLWNLPENSALKTLRKDPNVLMPGDIVYIPDLTVREDSGAEDMRHKYLLKGVPEVLRMRLVDSYHKPRPNLDYVIVIDGDARRGKTDGNGELKESIPPNAKSGQLVFAPPGTVDKNGRPIPPPKTLMGPNGKPLPGRPTKQVMQLQLGNLNPISEVSGLKARLANLKFYRGPMDDNLDDATTQAISFFQKRKGLPVTGVADDATKALLKELHGK